MDVLQNSRILKMRIRMRNNDIYIRHIRMTAIKEKRALTEDEYWTIDYHENENRRMDIYIRAGIA